MTEVRADAVVVGTGAGGAAVAAELAAGGLDVVVLEEGVRHDHRTFTARPRDMTTRLYRDAGQLATIGTPPIILPLGRAVGGTTLINSGTCFRTPVRVLEHGRATTAWPRCPTSCSTAGRHLVGGGGARDPRLPLAGVPGLRDGDSGPLQGARVRPRDVKAMAFHPLGTARAGADPARAVVDPDLQVHGLRGLYVADGSAVPSSPQVNPQVTIMALAVRLGRDLAGVRGGAFARMPA